MNKSLFNSQKKLIIGLSGGPDSVYLLHQLVLMREQVELTLTAVHLNHEWRSDAHNDVQLCIQLCAQLNVPLIVKKASELNYTPAKTGSREDEGRNLRRYVFETTLRELNADAVVLAHHADDQRETFFIRIIRGTTLTGLCAMKEIDGLYIRPLLHISKSEILEHLNSNSISYITDSSNSSDEYLRNRIRNHLMPALRQCDERSENNLSNLIDSLQKTEDFLTTITYTTYVSVTTQDILDTQKFNALNPVLQKRVLTHWLITNAPSFTLTERFLDEIIRFLVSPRGGAHQLGTTWQIVKKQHKAQIILKSL